MTAAERMKLIERVEKIRNLRLKKEYGWMNNEIDKLYTDLMQLDIFEI